ncbi:synaptonemal complex protein 2 [Megalops cyprinoides]|uniref:synaptonemal complex protein 2 n=1 Tax=Megalops cyprinoides TaxID=118141 RepID=UPI0018648676|nr:synaptonemal complex protein 2 [Megalops cyprinoides]
MAPCQDQQLEKLTDEALKHSDFQALETFLQDESKEGTHPKCSKQFINKLDKLINRELDKGNVKFASLGLSILHKFGKSLSMPGGQGMSGMVSQGLVKKMVQWFEKARKMWVEAGTQRNETLLSLAEDFFDALLVVHETNKEGRYQVTESFLHPVGQLAADSRVHILIQKEAIRKLNIILDKIPPELKKEGKILLSADTSALMNNLASRILEGGDYDLQIAVVEALCRMTSRAQRQQLADTWFNMEFIATAFSRIQDSEFETDCRRFLNLVNGMQGDSRRVYSYPCLEVFLGKHELLIPVDEKLEEFWIDFNLGSQSISFYFSLAKEETQQEGQWDTIFVPENEVCSYTVEEAHGRKTLKLMLLEPLSVGGVEGSELHIHFSQSLDILQAVQNVYGNAKNKRFVGKRSTSVVKTTVQIILDEGSSQVVPESQASQHIIRSLCGMDKGVASEMAPPPGSQEERARITPLPQAKQHPLQAVTPARRKVSESSTFVASSGGRSVGVSPVTTVLPASTPMLRGKMKPALEMVKSSERKKEYNIRELMMARTSESLSIVSTRCYSRREQDSAAVDPAENRGQPGSAAEKFHRYIPVDRVLEMVQTEKETEEQLLDDSTNMVPDSQPLGKNSKPMLPSVESRKRMSVTEVHQEQRSLSVQLQRPRKPPTPLPLAPMRGASSAATPDQGKQLSLPVDLQKFPSTTQLCSGDTVQSQPHAKLGSGKASQSQLRAKLGSAETSQSQLHAQLTQRLEELLKEREQPERMEERDHSLQAQKAQGTGPETAAQTKGTTPSLQKREDTPQKPLRPAPTGPGAQTSGPGMKKQRQKAIKSAEKSVMEKSSTRGSKSTSRSVKKGQSRKPPSNYAKKHLFSDTDTDHKTDVSWLRETAKPKMVDYSRQRGTKPQPPPADTTCETPGLGPPSPKLLEKQDKPMKKKQRRNTNQREKKPSAVASRPTGRPKRTTAMSKNYKEPSESGSASQSESEEAPRRKPRQKPANGKVERSVKAWPPLEKKNEAHPGGKTWAARLASFSPSPPPIERMRSVDKSAEPTRSPITPLRSLCASPQEVTAAFSGIHASSFYRTQRSDSTKTPSLGHTPCAPLLALSPIPTPLTPMSRLHLSQVPLSPTPALLTPTQPLLTSTAQEKSAAVSFPDSSRRSASLTSLTTQSRSSRKSISELVALSARLEKTPRSHGQKEAIQLKAHLSGPSFGQKRRASCHGSISSEDEEDEEDEQEEGEGQTVQGIKMRPRKLFKPSGRDWQEEVTVTCQSKEEESSYEEKEADVCQELTKKVYHSVQRERTADSGGDVEVEMLRWRCGDVEVEMLRWRCGNVEVRSLVSSHAVSSCWEASVEGEGDFDFPDLSAPQFMGSLCRQFSSELQRKFQNRSKRMELFTKQSLKTVQQHATSISVQVHQYRSQRLEKVRGILLEEISSLERDDANLKNMEKELATYWKKHTQALRSYQESETKRLQRLRSTFQNNVCHSLEYEEQIFTSQMCLMREDMKSVQDRLFKDMREEELLSVRRGLQTLFLPAGCSF